MLKKLFRQFLRNKKLFTLLFIGTFCWSLVMVKSGIEYYFGYGFWGPNGHDGVWHISLAESLSRGSLDNPVFAGEILKNYHIGFDLFLVFANKIINLSISSLYFQVLPVIFSFLIGFLIYKFIILWRGSKTEALWATAFVYFSSGFGFMISLMKDGIISGESIFWSQQSLSTLVNPPFALSLIFILLGINFWLKKNLYLSIIFFGLLIQIKAYAAILVLTALFLSAVYEFIKEKKYFTLKIFIGSLVINTLLFFTVKNDSTSVFSFQPFWFLETMMSYSDRLGWDRFYSAMTTYKMGNIWVKGILAYLISFIIFLVGNMGIRIVGLGFFYKLFKKEVKVNEILIFIISIILLGLTIPMFFVQKGTPWNTIQFFYYYLFFFSILAGISTKLILDKLESFNKKIFLLLIFIFFVLGSISTLVNYLPPTPPAKLSGNEIEALKFLAKKPDGVVLTYPFDKFRAKEAESFAPRPLHLYESTAYVSAFSKKDVYLEDEVNLNIMGYDWKTRRENVFWFVSNLDPEKGKEFLKNNNISYLYFVKNNSPLFGEYLRLGADDLNLNKIFENKEVLIYTVEYDM